MSAVNNAEPAEPQAEEDGPESVGWLPGGKARALLDAPPMSRGRAPVRAAASSGVRDVAPRGELAPSSTTEADTTVNPANLEPESQGPASWRHLNPTALDTATNLANEQWSFPPPPPQNNPSAEGDAESTGPLSSRRPLTNWRPKQRYSSYAPRNESRSPGSAFAIKVLDTSAELIQSYRLRYEVYRPLGYLGPNRSAMEIDEYDPYSIPFGAIAIDTREVVGTLRLITNRLQPFYESRIRRILDFCEDPTLAAMVRRPRRRPMPSMTSDLVREMLTEYNRDELPVEEISRGITHSSFRGTGVSRGLMKFGFAYATTAGGPILIGGCIPAHLPLYAHYGYEQLPGTVVAVNDVVHRAANTIVCNTRKLPEPTRSRVAEITEAMQWGAPEFLLETGVAESGAKSRYHYRDGIAIRSGRTFPPGR